MRFLILPAKDCSITVKESLINLVKESGHVPVSWSKELKPSDYDVVLAIPVDQDYILQTAANKASSFYEEIPDYWNLNIGRGLYDGLTTKDKTGVVVAYYHSPGITIPFRFLTGVKVEMYDEPEDYSRWGMLTGWETCEVMTFEQLVRELDKTAFSHGNDDLLLLS